MAVLEKESIQLYQQDCQLSDLAVDRVSGGGGGGLNSPSRRRLPEPATSLASNKILSSYPLPARYSQTSRLVLSQSIIDI